MQSLIEMSCFNPKKIVTKHCGKLLFPMLKKTNFMFRKRFYHHITEICKCLAFEEKKVVRKQ